MKGLILAGGTGTRLKPMTKYINKHLLPVYDKPMIYYPLSLLYLSGINDICIVCNHDDERSFRALLDEFSDKITIEYCIQAGPVGIPDAIISASDYIKNDGFAAVLGDNLIYGDSIPAMIKHGISDVNEGNISCFTYLVNDPENFGILKRDKSNHPTNIIEKPEQFVSNEAIIGLYLFPKNSMEYFKNIKKSGRGEYEIADVLENALKNQKLSVHRLGRGHVWLDLGTPQSIYEASSVLSVMQNRQGLKVGDLAELS